MARKRLNGSIQLKLNTSKYSLNLYENPNGSLALIKPEKINNNPTIMRANAVSFFILYYL